jgi:hypothetical protein
MATVAHHIVSRYDPQQRETSEDRPGVLGDGSIDPWQTESSFARRADPPHFLPATIPYDDWGSETADLPTTSARAKADPGKELASWYRNKVADTSGSVSDTPPQMIPAQRNPEPPSVKTLEKRNKNNWFIMKAIQSEELPSLATPAPTLADILARDPPPSSSQEKFVPPVWIALGPSNKGFAMLQQRGWNEGEGLGAAVHMSRRGVSSSATHTEQAQIKRCIGDDSGNEAYRVEPPSDGDDSQIQSIEAIEPTAPAPVSDDGFTIEDKSGSTSVQVHKMSSERHAQKALLTPIPTVLKSDRLGIGLKAKTYGPYKASQKRITHSSAAIAHAKARGEMKKMEVGRGKRSFERMRKKEAEKRKRLLAYMNE